MYIKINSGKEIQATMKEILQLKHKIRELFEELDEVQTHEKQVLTRWKELQDTLETHMNNVKEE